MRRTSLSPGLLAVVLAALLAACGSSTSTSTSTGSAFPGAGAKGPTSTTSAARGLTVSPSRAATNGQVSLRFIAPRSAGVHGTMRLSYVVSVSGPQRMGCTGTHSAAPQSAVQGQMTRVVLGPRQLGGNWCAGSYTARAEELQRAACKAGQMCPAYVRIVGTVGTAGFRIVPSGG